MIKSNILKKDLKKALEDKSESRVIRTSRGTKLMMIFMHYQPQQNSDSPEDKVVGIERNMNSNVSQFMVKSSPVWGVSASFRTSHP